jgi:hypothetical protein
MRADSRLRVREPDVAAKVIDGEAVIINLASGMYYSLNGSGSAVWELIEKGCTLAEASEAVRSAFNVSAETAERDVSRLWENLLTENLVVLSDDTSSKASPAGSISVNAGTEYAAPALTKFEDMVDLFAADPPLPELPTLENSDRKGA